MRIRLNGGKFHWAEPRWVPGIPLSVQFPEMVWTGMGVIQDGQPPYYRSYVDKPSRCIVYEQVPDVRHRRA